MAHTNIYSNRFICPTRPNGMLGKDKTLSVIIIGSNATHKMKSVGTPSLLKDKYGTTVLEHQTSILKTEFPTCEIILVCGYECDRLVKNRPSGVRIVENQKFEELGEIEDIRLGLNNSLYENVLIIHNSLYFSPSIIKNITNQSSVITDNNENLVNEDVGSTIVDGHVTILSLAIKSPKWGKIAFFQDKELKILKQYSSNRSNSKLFYYEAINHILEKNGQFKNRSVKSNEIFVNLDSTKEIEKI